MASLTSENGRTASTERVVRLVEEDPELFAALEPAVLARLAPYAVARGLLADTAVVVMSEHGRTPRVQNVAGGGRDHWSRAYSAAFAGAGFAKGRVVGRTDRIGGDVVDAPFSPKDVVATLHRATVAALADAAVRKSLGDLGVDIVGNTPEEFTAYIKAEIPKWTAIVKASGATLD